MHRFIRSTVLALGAGAALAHAAAAQTLTAVTVGAPQINCLFSTSCTVVVNDLATPYLGNGFLQSRVFQAQPGSPAAGKWVYEYRVDLTQVATTAAPVQVTSLAIPFAPSALTMDFNGDGAAAEQVFVVTSGGLGSIGPATVQAYGDTIHVAFSPPVPGGQTTYFFGFLSNNPPHDTQARIVANVAPETHLAARGPSFGGAAPTPGGSLRPNVPRPRPAPVKP
jgi:hypothetical protein